MSQIRRVWGRLWQQVRKVGLVRQFAILSLLPLLLLGLVLGNTLETVIQEQALANARQEAQVLAEVAIKPLLQPEDLHGLTPDRIHKLDDALRATTQSKQVALVKIWNPQFTVVYSTTTELIGHTYPSSDELEDALAGQVASDIDDLQKAENDRDRAYGKLLEVYVPLRFGTEAKPAGAFEIYLPYQPIAAAIAGATARLYLFLGAGLTLLYVVLLPIVASASRRLRRQAAQNAYQATHDALTDLPNRTLFQDRVSQALLLARRNNQRVAVMILDLDRFKEVNDTLGHQSGDLLLIDIGKRLHATLRDSDTMARLGGDEFAVLLPQIAEQASAQRVAQKLLQSLEGVFVLNGVPVEIRASIGVALYPDHGDRAETLLQKADVAMYLAKDQRQGSLVYEAGRDRYSPARLALIGQLRRAIEQHELVLHYQPKRGLIYPDEFIGLAEHTGLIGLLTRYVLQAALRQCRAWHDQGLDLTVAVNLSVRDLLDLEFPERLAALLKETSVESQWLELEITESTMMQDPGRAKEVLTRLHGMGIKLAVDDFGTGYSSLAYLRQLPLGEIKIDKSFVLGMADADEAIVRAIVDLGRNLRLQVVAEGVETGDVSRRLTGLGCDLAQGYYISRPVPAEDLTAWVRKRAIDSPQPSAAA
jgi:diguanylate cyclase (GGDEF)-like protein